VDQVDTNGIIAGGMADGFITLWSVSKILERAEQEKMGRGCLCAQQIHNGTPVSTLEFNPLRKNLLASGGSEVLIQDITNLKKPTKFKPGEPNFHEGHRITSISWNRMVNHILASASEDGKIVVWDLKTSKSIFQFNQPKQSVSEYDYFNTGDDNAEKPLDVKETKIIWNPTIATQFVVASDDDQNPSFNIWDLRNPQYPVATYQNLHSQGITSVNWCPHDFNLVASSAKDSQTIVTNFKTGEIVLEFPTSEVHTDVKWSNKMPGKLATTTVNGDTSILSYSKVNNENKENAGAEGRKTSYAPKWLFPKCGARFGFGGKLISFQGKCLKQHTQVVEPAESQMCRLVEGFDKELQ
jgi:protein transport protein SEC31